MKTKLASVALLLFSTVITVSAQSEPKYSFEASTGYHRFPGFLFNIDKSVTDHPANLSGMYKEFGFRYSLNQRWSLGVSFVDIRSAGNGQWSRDTTPQELADNGVAGIITGRTNITNRGFTITAQRTFRHGKRLQPYLRFGGGLGWLNVRFDGQFIGHETESGLNMPVINDASDHITQKIPLVVFEPGLRCRITSHISFSVAPFWNTGFGAKAGATISF